jgi:2-amino-4-hydroxy-6-hydroxymethyldihydropteridine diphosphokinase
MAEAYLLLGSNKGDREEYLATALSLLELRCGAIIAQSSIYETEAWGEKQQNSFLNKAIKIITPLTPAHLLTEIKLIEREIGRTLSTHWGPREIDIDVLLYGSEIIDLPQLKVPHPHLHERRFTLTPLSEIAQEVVHPILQHTILMLLNTCNDTNIVRRL